MKEIGRIQKFICSNQDCITIEFEGQYSKGIKGFAKPPRCPKCNSISETIKGVGNLSQVKTKGHKRYAKNL